MIRFDRYNDGKQYAATFSYDDGCGQDQRLVDIFNKYGVKCTFNLYSAPIVGDEKKIAEMRERYAGHEIACHAFHHPHLERMTIKAQYDELMSDREFLEKTFGGFVRGLAFPFGTWGEDTITAMKTAGLEYGRTTVATRNFTIPDDFMTWNPTCHHNESENIIKQFIFNAEKAPWRAGGLLYIWGHAYEFEQEGANVDFDEMERRVAMLAESAHNIWFATNIEIVDYLKAQKQVRVSADGHRVYNPTQIDVWASNDNDPICFKAGAVTEI